MNEFDFLNNLPSNHARPVRKKAKSKFPVGCLVASIVGGSILFLVILGSMVNTTVSNSKISEHDKQTAIKMVNYLQCVHEETIAVIQSHDGLIDAMTIGDSDKINYNYVKLTAALIVLQNKSGNKWNICQEMNSNPEKVNEILCSVRGVARINVCGKINKIHARLTKCIPQMIDALNSRNLETIKIKFLPAWDEFHKTMEMVIQLDNEIGVFK